jgi:hypothetical protein
LGNKSNKQEEIPQNEGHYHEQNMKNDLKSTVRDNFTLKIEAVLSY